jgi:MFS family permease
VSVVPPGPPNEGGPTAPRQRRVTIPAAIAPLLLEFPDLDMRIWVLAIARVIVTASFALVMPFLAMHLAVERHVSVLQIGYLWTVVGLVSALVQWLAGQLAGRTGYRRLLLSTMLLRSVNLAALGYAIGARAGFPVIGALCVVNGAMRALYDPVASAYVTAISGPKERVAAFSLFRVGSSLGWALGPLAATLASGLSYSTLFYASAPLTVLAALAVSRIGDPPKGETTSTPTSKARLRDLVSFRHDATFVRFLWATFVFYVMQTQMYHIMAIYAAKYVGLDRAQVATLFTLNGIMVVLIQLPAVRFIRKVGMRKALVAGSLGYFLSYAVCGFANGYFPLVACVALATLCEIFAVPAQQSAVTGMAPPGRVATYAGLFGVAQGAAQTIGPMLGTLLIELLDPHLAWLLLASLGVIAAWGYRPRKSIGQLTLTPYR